MTVRFARPFDSKGEQDGSVSGVTIRLIRVLDSAPNMTQQMEVVAQVKAPANANACRRWCAVRVGGLMQKLGANLKLG
jgi:hypothetical protein